MDGADVLAMADIAVFCLNESRRAQKYVVKLNVKYLHIHWLLRAFSGVFRFGDYALERLEVELRGQQYTARYIAYRTNGIL
jgi:hypothetical protein